MTVCLTFSGISQAEDNAVTTVDGVYQYFSGYPYAIGQSGTNNLFEVIHGGTGRCSRSAIGVESTAHKNHARITGAGSLWEPGSYLYVGMTGSMNTLTISSNAMVKLYRDPILVGQSAGSSSNEVRVLSGGILSVHDDHFFINAATNSSYSSLIVSGPGSTFCITNDTSYAQRYDNLIIGNAGPYASLLVSNGATMDVRGFCMGYHSNAFGNTVTFTGPDINMNWTNEVDAGWTDDFGILVGREGGSNTFSITDGATFTYAPSPNNGYTILGTYSSSPNNKIVVSGTNTEFLMTDTFIIGRESSHNEVLVSDGAILAAGSTYLGMTENANSNTLLLEGPGCRYSNGFIVVGSTGSYNRLVITNGAKFVGDQSCNLYLGFTAPSSHNLLRVSDPGTEITVPDKVRIGYRSTGNKMEILNGARYSCYDSTYFGANDPSCNNTMIVAGAGTTMSCLSNRFYGGYYSDTNLFMLTDGAALECKDFYAGYSGVGNTFIASGENTILTATDIFSVGYNGVNNRMIINSNASLQVRYLRVAFFASSVSNTLEISGQTVVTNVSSLDFGNQGQYNTMVLTNGAQLFITNDISMGSSSTGIGNYLHVTGSNSLLSCGDSFVFGSDSGHNHMLIDHGAVLHSRSFQSSSYGHSTPSNRIEISGSGSVFSNREDVSFSCNDSTFSVRDGAKMYARNFYVEKTNELIEFIGPDTSCRLTGDFAAGYDPNIRVLISNATFSAPNVDLGNYATNNTFRITGSNAVLSANYFMFSDTGIDNELFIEDGARISAIYSYFSRSDGGHHNRIVFSGEDTLSSNSMNIYFGAASSSSNTMTLTNGATVWCSQFFHGQSSESRENNLYIYSNATLLATNKYTLYAGTNHLLGGSVQAGVLHITNYPTGNFIFDSGSLETHQTLVDTGSPFPVGNGTDPATIVLLQDNSPTGHIFLNGLIINTNAALAGNGVIHTGKTEMLTNSQLQPGGTGQVATLTLMDLDLGDDAGYCYDLSTTSDLVRINGDFTATSNSRHRLYLNELPGADWQSTTNVFLTIATNKTRVLWELDRSNAPGATNIGVFYSGGDVSLAPIKYQYIAKDGMDVPLYESWFTAATNIPNAVAYHLGGIPILIGDGTWHTGGGDVSDSVLTLDNLTLGLDVDPFSVNVCVGIDGDNNALFMRNGALLSCYNLTLSRDISSSGNNATITDSGTIVTNLNHLYVGLDGSDSELIISSNAEVYASMLDVGYNSSGNALRIEHNGNLAVDITHVGDSSLANSNLLFISDSTVHLDELRFGSGGSDNTLILTNGAVLHADNTFIGEAHSTNSTCIITGADTVWSNSLYIYLGTAGTQSHLDIRSGAKVYASTMILGTTTSSDDVSLTLSGTDSQLLFNDLYIGDEGYGNIVSVAGGATITGGVIYVGDNGYANNRLIVSKDGTVVCNNGLHVQNGTNELSGGTMNLSALTVESDGSFDFNSGTLNVDDVESTGNPFVVGNGSSSADIYLTGTSLFNAGLQLNQQSKLHTEGMVGGTYLQLSGGSLEINSTNAGILATTNLVIDGSSHYYIDAGSATQDLIRVIGDLSNSNYPTVTLHVRNLGDADWTTDKTILTYGSVTGEINWIVDLGDSGAQQLTVVHEPSINAYVLKEPTIYYVAPGGSDTFPYDRWDRASDDLQTVADLCDDGDYIYVSNGIYTTEGRVTPGGSHSNRLCVTNAVYVEAVNGPEVTTILGSLTERCVYLGDGATLRGFALSDGYTDEGGHAIYDQDGGGALLDGNAVIWDCIVTNCNAGGDGGGIRGVGSTKVRDCLVNHNTATLDGGGVYECSVYESTIIENWANGNGGGMFNGSAVNSIIYHNDCGGGSSNYTGSTFTYSCTAPLPGGSGNTADEPQLIDYSGGNFYPCPTSSVINAGSNTDVLGTNDITGFTRIYSGQVDMGAYESFLPWLSITNPVNNQTNSYDYDTYTFEGENNYNTTIFVWSNALSGVTGTASSVDTLHWSGSVALAVGTNDVTMTGINSVGDATNTSVTIIRADVGTGIPVIDITDPTDNSHTVSYVTTSYTVSGTNNIHVFGTMWISNAMNGEVYSFAASSNWTAPSVYLATGTNSITVWGTNLWQQTASDTVNIIRSTKQGGDSNLTYYVSTNGSHIAPFITWATAATQMQDAVNQSYDDDTVLVAAGTYNTGGEAAPGASLTNRVYVRSAINLLSVDGYTNTFIVGQADPSSTNGPAAIRGVYLATNATISGFTVMDAHSGDSSYDAVAGGIFINGNGTISNCVIRDCSAKGGGAVYCHVGGHVTHAELRNNSGYNTGGIMLDDGALIEHSTIVSNDGRWGGGIYFYEGGVADQCIIEHNTSPVEGGGVYVSSSGFISNSIIRNNAADSHGGGIHMRYNGQLVNSLIVDNYALLYGAGVLIDHTNQVINCTIANNTADSFAGGLYSGGVSNHIYNCIIYSNSAPSDPNHGKDTPPVVYANTCSTPDLGATGCITNNPLFANIANNNFHIYSDSPCVNAGSNSYVEGSKDLDGNPRILDGTVDMGCYELDIPLLNITNDNATVYGIVTTYTIGGICDTNIIGTMFWTNGLNNTGGSLTAATNWTISSIPLAFGTNEIRVVGTNRTYGGGVDTVVITRLKEYGGYTPFHYAAEYGTSGNVYPYDSEANAAWVLQDAIDAASSSDTVYAVSSGTYDRGGAVTPGYSLTNRVMVDKQIKLRSYYGPTNTFIVGASDGGSNGNAAIRGVYLANGAMLEGFTVRGGYTMTTGEANLDRGGGGVIIKYDGTITNCIIDSNTADHYGGGIDMHHGGYVVDCLIYSNAAGSFGGGIMVEKGTVTNCTIFNNYTDNDGGGIGIYSSGMVYNVSIYSNTVADCGGGAFLHMGGIIENSDLFQNTASNDAGGICFNHGGTAYDLNVYSNTSVDNGGGVYMNQGGTLSNSTIERNFSMDVAGGLFLCESSLVSRCIIRDNFAGDTTTEDGGGIFFYNGGTARNCLITGNEATNCGGGIMFDPQSSNAILESCTIISNTAEVGGGMRLWNGTVRNCIVYDNSAWGSGNNWSHGGNTPNIEYSCTTPTNSIPGGEGCITNQPLLVSGGDFSLQTGSPCVNAGTNQPWMVDSRDLGTNGRIADVIVDMGAYELDLPALVTITSSPATVYGEVTTYSIGGTNNRWAAGTMWWTNNLSGQNGTMPAASPWSITDFFLAFGDNLITVYVTNDSGYANSDSITITRKHEHGQPSPYHYVATNGNAIWPYTNLTDAATNIQMAVATATTGDAVYVYAGTYNTGGDSANGHGLTNRIMIDRAITVIGVDGPSNTIVVGRGNVGPYGIRCAYLTNGAFLAGFTLTNGHTFASGNEFFERSGGGAFMDNGGVISNCIITGCEADYHGGGIMVCTNGRIINSSINGNDCNENGGGIMLMTNGSVDRCYIYNNRSATDGGGIHFFNSGIVQNTLVTSNRATSGAGVYSYSDGSLATAPRLYNCTIVHNAASFDAGGVRCLNSTRVFNCIIRSNTATSNPQYGNYRNEGFNISWGNNCVTPAVGGDGNITNDPLFMIEADQNYRLIETSPCINAGTNLSVIGSLDLDGNPRLVGANLDMGAYEYGTATYGTPRIAITTTPATVSYVVSTCSIYGTNNNNIVGTMLWTNSLSGDNGTLSSTTPWSITNIALVTGDNTITVTGTNRFGNVGSDSVTITREMPGSGPPYLSITTQPATVTYDTTIYTVQGTNNENVVGTMNWTNALAGSSGSLNATSSWTVADIPLDVGTNLITVIGTNLNGTVTNDSVNITRGPAGTGIPYTAITNTPATVTYDVSTYTIGGTNNANVIGTMSWTNSLTGNQGTFSAFTPWSVTNIALNVGANTITITATNATGTSTSDNITITRGGPGTGTPYLAVTTTPATVSYDVESYDIAGTNNINVVGTMWWTNDLTGDNGTLTAVPSWSITNIALSVGANTITMSGTNASGTSCSDTVTITRSAATRLYVNANTPALPGSQTGIDWNSAFADLQDALASTATNCDIWMAAGVYRPDQAAAGVAIVTNNDPNSRFVVPDGVALYGGFNGTETNLSQRDASANVTVLSGDIDLNDTTNSVGVITNDPQTAIQGTNSYNVVRLTSGNTIILDGLRITAGYAPSSPDSGAGIQLNNADATIRDCMISGNWCDYNGAGLDGGGTVTITNCILTANRAGRGSAASLTSGTIRYDNCSIHGNYGNDCAGLFMQDGNATITSCRIYDNEASSGTALFHQGAHTLEVINSLITGNRSSGDTAGALMKNGKSTFINCTFSGNHSASRAGVLSNEGGNTSVVQNCVFWNNSVGLATNQPCSSISNALGTTTLASYSLIANSGSSTNWNPLIGVDNGNNLDTYAYFKQEDVPGSAPTANGNYQLLACSPAINSGDNSLVAVSNDIAGNTRIYAGTVDMGAYEAYPDSTDTDSDNLNDWPEVFDYHTDMFAPDTDGDTMTDGDEVYAGTDPTNAASYFGFDMIDIQGTNTVLSWQSASNRTYSISTTLDLSESIWQNIITNITATPPLNVYTTKNSTILLRSYRLEVQQ